MGLADDILKRGNRAPLPKPEPKPDTASEALAESSEAQGQFLDRQPTIAQAVHPREAFKQTVHVDNFPVTSGTTDVTDRAARLLGHVAVDSSALPAGASTAALQGSVIADAPLGTESAQITRDILRKKSVLETNTPLAANGVFTGAWHDTEIDGTMYVACTAVSNVAGLGNGMVLQESEDQVVANLRLVMAAGNSTATRVSGFIRARYWRIMYTNAGTIQASFSLYSTSCNMIVAGGNQGTGPSDPFQIISAAGNQGTLTDGIIATTILSPAAQNVATLLAIAGWIFNGASFDREHGNWTIATGDTGAKVATFNGATQTNFDSRSAVITIILGTVTGTTPTLSAQLQWSPDGGTTWINLDAALANLTATGQTGVFLIGPGINTAQTTGATATKAINAPLPRTWRLVFTIAGTTPSFTISSVQVNYGR